MTMSSENIEQAAVEQAAEPEFRFPENREDNSKPNETAEVVTREETNTELWQSIDKKLDLLLAAQTATQATKEE